MTSRKAVRIGAVVFALGAGVFLVDACDDDDEAKGASPDAAAGGSGGGGAGGAGGTGGRDASADAATNDATATSDASRDGAASDGGAAAPVDTDLVAVRFLANGTLDTTFGTNGVARVDLGAGTGTTRDALWNVARDGMDRLVLFGAKRGDGGRVDSDRAVVRLTANGALDTTFATMGVHALNIANLSDQARNGSVQADGRIVSAGYTGQPTGYGTQTSNKVVLLRLLDNGMPDTTFGAMGVVNSAPFAASDPVNLPSGLSEAYAAFPQATGNYVTAGYGRAGDAPGTTVNMVSFRYTPAGKLDTTWGMNGILQLDVAGDNDRGRNLVVLPGDRVLILGSGTPAPMNIDAMAVMVQPNGALDTTFDGDGYKLYDFGRPDEAFYGAALAPGGAWAVAVGYRAGGTGMNDDATILFLPVGGTGTEVVKAVPLSDTANDRFWGVTFDAAGKALAAGFVSEGGDNRMALARYNMDGTLDATFGTAGVAKINVATAGTEETARGVVVQSDGKIVIAGVVEH
jgi:uncharacterized delta-60 repeat protein